MIHGYTAGTFDLYHPDHALLLERARSRCDHLTVAVSTDELVASYKKPAALTYQERCAVISSVRWVDSVVPQTSLDKVTAWHKLKYDVLFVGDDWYSTPDWRTYETELTKADVPVIYIPTTRSISSTQIKDRIRGD